MFLINSDAPVGTYNATRCTADAIVGPHSLHVGIAVHIDTLLGQCYHIFRTRHDAELTALATLGVHHNSSFYLCHIYLFYKLSAQSRFYLNAYKTVQK